MSGKLCKKCGCVVFDQESDYCDACKPQEQSTNNKKDLLVCNKASAQLKTVNDILIVVVIFMSLTGVIMSICGLEDAHYDPTLLICGIITILVPAIVASIACACVNSLIAITKSAEYYNAQTEEKFNIRYSKLQKAGQERKY